jgi:ribosomal protein L28
MSRTCAICDKKSIKTIKLVKLRGKYNPTAIKRKYPNLQWLTLASGERIKACTKCIKTQSKKSK